jgi:hypothetical protein
MPLKRQIAMDRKAIGDNPCAVPARHQTPESSTWRQKYGVTHRLQRVKDFPVGIRPPDRVRIYQRGEYFLLQWWDKQEKRTLSERVDGDLVSAISRARAIDERLICLKSSGRKSTRYEPAAVVKLFIADLQHRADAGEIDVATVRRYSSALQRHFVPYVEQPSVQKRYRLIAALDRDFRLEFASYLKNRMVSPNGHPHAQRRPLRNSDYVLDVVRAMLAWAADPDRGNLLSDGFRNPFEHRVRDSQRVVDDVLSQPDVTVVMAVDLLMACDEFQLSIFGPLILYGLRPGELGWLFREFLTKDWIRVPCILELDYLTKGRREKGFPVIDCLAALWRHTESSYGLLSVNRQTLTGKTSPPRAGESLAALVAEYRRRCGNGAAQNPEPRRRIRDGLMCDAGQLNYDHIEAEFQKLSTKQGWSAAATLKDLRHLFSTCLENAGVPEFYRRYLMGQSFGRAPIVAYTHVTQDQVRKHFSAALQSELAPIVAAIRSRAAELGVPIAQTAA